MLQIELAKIKTNYNCSDSWVFKVLTVTITVVFTRLMLVVTRSTS